MPVSGFADLLTAAKTTGSGCLSVAGGNDPEVMKAVVMALDEGLVSCAIVTGDAAVIKAGLSAAAFQKITLINATDAGTCAKLAVEAVRNGDADILMKGHVDSTSYLRAIVNRETGIRKGGALSNVTVAEMPSYPKLIAATDNGIIPAPTLEQKREIILNTAPLFRGLDVKTVKVAALAATEKVSNAIPATVDAATLASESKNGQFPGFIIDGPFGYDVAVSKAAAVSKNLESSKVAGDSDLLLFSSIDAANAVAKAWKFHGQAQTGSIVLGAKVPVLLNSRSDGVGRRINALLLALAVRAGEKT